MDIFLEHLVKHKRTAKENLMVIGIYFAGLVLFILSAVLMMRFKLFNFWGVAALAIIYGMFYLLKQFSLEYEYTLTNGELDIDKIISKNDRKRVVSFRFKDVEICASVNNDAYKNAAGIVKIYDCTGDGKEGVYFIDVVQGEGKCRILFQPPVEMLEGAQKYNPNNIFI